MDVESEDEPPSPAQLDALTYVMERQSELLRIVGAALRAYYNEVRPRYVSFLDNPALEMPTNPHAVAFGQLHVLQIVYVHPVQRDGEIRLGFSFRVAWDIEHGLGVIVQGDRVVDVGEAAIAFC